MMYNCLSQSITKSDWKTYRWEMRTYSRLTWAYMQLIVILSRIRKKMAMFCLTQDVTLYCTFTDINALNSLF